MQDVDHTAVMAEFERLYPEEYQVYLTAITNGTSQETTDEEEILLQRAVELKRVLYKQHYSFSNHEILDEYIGLEKQVFVSEYAPIAIVEVDSSSASEIARCEEVVAISEYEEIAAEVAAEVQWPAGISSEEIVQHIELSNQITRGYFMRDTRNLDGTNIKIGILEAGGVPDANDAYLQNATFFVRPGDEGATTHATTVAMILAAVDPDGTEYGLVPNARFYCANVNNTTGVYDDIEWMISNGVNIINASWGYTSSSYSGNYDTHSQWIDHIAAVHDVHFIKSAGNNGSYVTSPGMAYNAITVGDFRANGSDEVSGFTMYASSSYREKAGNRPEKPNLVANGYFGDRNDGSDYFGTSFAAPQVAGVIAQLCGYDGHLKFRQSVMGALLAASSAEKVEAVGNGYKGDHFISSIEGSEQISDKEGAGILDARWAWGILANHNYWHLKLDGDDFPYEQTISIDLSENTISRVAIYWTKNNTDFDHTTNSLGSNNPQLTNFDLYIYDSEGNLVASSTTLYSNFEIVQFVPSGTGVYTVVISGTTDMMEFIGLALW